MQYFLFRHGPAWQHSRWLTSSRDVVVTCLLPNDGCSLGSSRPGPCHSHRLLIRVRWPVVGIGHHVPTSHRHLSCQCCISSWCCPIPQPIAGSIIINCHKLWCFCMYTLRFLVTLGSITAYSWQYVCDATGSTSVVSLCPYTMVGPSPMREVVRNHRFLTSNLLVRSLFLTFCVFIASGGAVGDIHHHNPPTRAEVCASSFISQMSVFYTLQI